MFFTQVAYVTWVFLSSSFIDSDSDSDSGYANRFLKTVQQV